MFDYLMRKNRGKCEKMLGRSKLSFASRDGDTVCRDGRKRNEISLAEPANFRRGESKKERNDRSFDENIKFSQTNNQSFFCQADR